MLVVQDTGSNFWRDMFAEMTYFGISKFVVNVRLHPTLCASIIQQINCFNPWPCDWITYFPENHYNVI